MTVHAPSQSRLDAIAWNVHRQTPGAFAVSRFAAGVSSQDVPQNGVLAGLREPGSEFGLPETPNTWRGPRMVRSVVDEAGLGRFVYLQGRSGRRYVFGAIRPEQARMYDCALFAQAEHPGVPVRLSNTIEAMRGRGGTLYVHLLKDEDGDGSDVLSDLTGYDA